MKSTSFKYSTKVWVTGVLLSPFIYFLLAGINLPLVTTTVGLSIIFEEGFGASGVLDFRNLYPGWREVLQLRTQCAPNSNTFRLPKYFFNLEKLSFSFQ